MGPGPGFLLKFLKDKYPHLKVQGIDIAENLIKIGTELCGSPLIAGNYLTAKPDHLYDLVICTFWIRSSPIL
jgi:hypothetical protein